MKINYSFQYTMVNLTLLCKTLLHEKFLPQEISFFNKNILSKDVFLCSIDSPTHKCVYELKDCNFSNAKRSFNGFNTCTKNTFHVVKFCVAK